MLDIEQNQKNLDFTKSKLADIRADHTRKETEYDAAKSHYADRVAQTTGRQRYPKSLDKQRDKVLKLKVELEALQEAQAAYEQKVKEAERNLALCKLYHEQGQHCLDQQQKFTEQIKSIDFAISNLQAAVETFTDIAAEFFQNPTGSIDTLRAFATNSLFAKVSLEQFLQGKIKQTENQENARFLDSQEKKLLQQSSTLPSISEDLMDELQWWAKALLEFASNPASIQRKSYVPAEKRPVQGITSQTFIVPPHARAGPEVDEAEDPRSDKWFHRRRALRPKINANKPVGKT